MDEKSPFASRSVAIHILRGVIGVAALVGVFMLLDSHPWGALALGVVMLAAFRGCPMCWTMGLCETIYRRGK